MPSDREIVQDAFDRPSICNRCGSPDVTRAVWFGANDGGVHDILDANALAEGSTGEWCESCEDYCCILDAPESHPDLEADPEAWERYDEASKAWRERHAEATRSAERMRSLADALGPDLPARLRALAGELADQDMPERAAILRLLADDAEGGAR